MNRKNILLVDDDTTVRQSLEQALTLENFDVVPAGNEQEALRGFNEHRIDIVLLDLNLGPESGWDTFCKLRKIRPRLPVIIISGCPQQQSSLLPQQPVNGFMEKPLDLALLIGLLNDLAVEPRSGHTVRTRKRAPLQEI